jgi:hypothetical protein
MFIMVCNVVLPCLKLLAFEFLFEILEIYRLRHIPDVNVVLLDVYQPLIRLAEMLIYLTNNWSYLIIFKVTLLCCY